MTFPFLFLFSLADPSTWGTWNNWGAGPWEWPNSSVPPPANIVVPPTYGYNTAGGQALLDGAVASTFDYNHGSSESNTPNTPTGGFWQGSGAAPSAAPPHHAGNDVTSAHPFAKQGRGGTWKRGGSRPPARDRFLRSDRKSAEIEDVDTTQTIGKFSFFIDLSLTFGRNVLFLFLLIIYLWINNYCIQKNLFHFLIFYFIDAAKRRNLPGWIREGLEKMEREKQRKIERELQLKEREEILRQKIQEEEEALAEADEPMMPKKSKFVSKNDLLARNFSVYLVLFYHLLHLYRKVILRMRKSKY